ncbi:MAG: DUF3422 family protein [Brucellaceae bacterium]|nr:DUF3422 family protein [Brucellaceae bacterium]
MNDTGDPSGAERVYGFPVHPDRARALGEVHARPAPLFSAPRLLIQLAFVIEGDADADFATISSLARSAGAVAPDASVRHHTIPVGSGLLHWERHTEFSTFSWEGPLTAKNASLGSHPFGSAFSAPGKVISGVRLEIRKWTKAAEKLVDLFDPASLCFSTVEGGKAAIVTDFRQDGDGLTRVLILDGGLTNARTGLLAQRVLEIETYRTLAMLGLPLAQTLSSDLRRMEDKLADITSAMRSDSAERDNVALLADLAALAAELESQAASSGYRFGASRAYDGIVTERLSALRETSVEGHKTWTAFLEKRLAPAMRTCRSVAERQESLSRKLARTTQLLRSWVDVELESQNRSVLESMNRRARLQLRLQQTVEGLSVAAVSYYVVGLIGYVAKGLEKELPVSATLVTALSVPLVVFAIWQTVRRIRRAHSGD